MVNTYDGAYRLRSRRNPLNQLTTFDYDAAGNLLREVRSSSGLTLEHGPYDDANRPLGTKQAFTDPVTNASVTYTATTSYLDGDHAVETIDPRGVMMREVFNGHDALIERIVDAGHLDLTTTRRLRRQRQRAGRPRPRGPGARRRGDV